MKNASVVAKLQEAVSNCDTENTDTVSEKYLADLQAVIHTVSE